jgi:hypothetical protein
LIASGRRIVLVRPDTEPQNRCLYTVDGDEVLMRQVVRWLADVVRDRDEDLASWLELRGDNYDPDAPVYDPRLDRDRLVDGVYWNANDPFLPPAPPDEQARIQREDIPAYHAFIRAHIDPTFRAHL